MIDFLIKSFFFTLTRTCPVTDPSGEDSRIPVSSSCSPSDKSSPFLGLCERMEKNNVKIYSIDNIENITKIEIPQSDTTSYEDVLLDKLYEKNNIDKLYYYDIINDSKGGDIVKSDNEFEVCYNIMHFLSLIEFEMDTRFLLDAYKKMGEIGIKFEKSDKLYISADYKKLVLFKNNICYII